MARLGDRWLDPRQGVTIALLVILCLVAGAGAPAFAEQPSPVPDKSVSQPDPAIKIEPRSFKDLTPHERAASYNAAWLKVEPDRMVPAEKWKSPYCTEWDDNCTRCSRPDATSDPVCRPINASESTSCEPKIVQCSLSDDLIQSLCTASEAVSGPDGRGEYSVSICEFFGEAGKVGDYNYECRNVANITVLYEIRPSNIPGWPGYNRLPDGALTLSAPEGVFPRGKSNQYCTDLRRDKDGWVIDKWRPGF